MNIESLASLSFEQLDEIQKRVDHAIREKKVSQVGNAASDVVDLLAKKYPRISFLDVLDDLISLGQIFSDSADRLALRQRSNTLDMAQKDRSILSRNLSVQNTGLLVERIKNIRNSVLKSDNSRLLWLTNGGNQKTSKMFGKELAEALQEAIKKIDRLESFDDDTDKDMSLELLRIDEWVECKLGISLLQGTLTVINPSSLHADQASSTPRSSQRSPLLSTEKSDSSPTLNFPIELRRGLSGYGS